MNLSSIILLLQTVLSLLVQPNMAQNPQIQAMANQAMRLAQVALSSNPVTQEATSSITYSIPQGNGTTTQPITINVTNPPIAPALGATSPSQTLTPMLTNIKISRAPGNPMDEYTIYANHQEAVYLFLYDQNGDTMSDATATVSVNGGDSIALNQPPYNARPYFFQYSFSNAGISTLAVNTLGVTKTIQVIVLPRH